MPKLVYVLTAIASASLCAGCVIGQTGARRQVEFTEGDIGKIITVYELPIYAGDDHGLLLENEQCPKKSIVIEIDDLPKNSSAGVQLRRVATGGGKLGPVPKYVYISGTLSIHKGAHGAIEASLLSVSSVREQAIDYISRLDRIERAGPCSPYKVPPVWPRSAP